MSGIIERPGELVDKYYKKYDHGVQDVYKVTNPGEIVNREKALADAKPGAKLKKQINESANLF